MCNRQFFAALFEVVDAPVDLAHGFTLLSNILWDMSSATRLKDSFPISASKVMVKPFLLTVDDDASGARGSCLLPRVASAVETPNRGVSRR